ncbi:hypothetical protein [Kitasatospora sp. NBC_01266]|uniref:hypothetical protein n=1 Tax=Kitasatospora sp. NBC_01266 TaxID=2903572 RepID=UPI002E375499|nr:hypothetical protein [Kitasatospora sp. NBC_01266]
MKDLSYFYSYDVVRDELTGKIRVLRCPDDLCHRLVGVAGGRLIEHDDYYQVARCELSGVRVVDQVPRRTS